MFPVLMKSSLNEKLSPKFSMHEELKPVALLWLHCEASVALDGNTAALVTAGTFPRTTVTPNPGTSVW